MSTKLPVTAATTDPAPYSSNDLDPFISGCPHWCERAGQHLAEWARDDRVHESEAWTVLASAENMEPYGEGFYPASVSTYLMWRHLYAEPLLHLSIDRGGCKELNLTLTEAEAMVAEMTRLLALARGGAS